ncbi:ABC transporter ATP-binding protein [Litorivicinus lipolyticus]|uniref:ABC transporter ATP-binding protein n=1 Tax=Litorivicinus lipolyticus TaxID=418701 RepID=UPI003B59F7CE
MSAIQLSALTKYFGDTQVINSLDLGIGDGELAVFVGPSGCGKSTTLRMIAGLEDPSSGEIWMGNERIDTLPPAKRGIAMVFQSYALYPHCTVRGNLGFALKHAGMARADIEAKVNAVADVLDLTSLMKRYPKELSGGQRQRVAIGRALVREPEVFLFDEPLSNLDAALRVKMRVEILKLHRRLKRTMVYVTHDQVEAMTLADKIVVFNAGSIEQVGKPLDLYAKPANKFVAGFIGSPAMNFFSSGAGALLCPTAAEAANSECGVRPEHLEIRLDGAGLSGCIEVFEHLGNEAFAHVRVGTDLFVVRVNASAQYDYDQPVVLRASPENLHRFSTTTGQRID